MREVRADLHMHTILSACAEVEMLPPLIVEEALHKGLDIIAITDHNTTGNVAAVMQAAAGTDLIVLPSMELQSREEIDMLCIFENLDQAYAWQAWVDPRLPDLCNDAERFGPQYIVDAEGDLVEEELRMLQAPALVGIEEAAQAVHRLGGLAIPAHIDRSSGLMQALGLWPVELQADAVEVSYNMRPSEARLRYRFLPEIPIISNSDAHWLDWIGKVMTIFVVPEHPTLEDLRNALWGRADCRMYVP